MPNAEQGPSIRSRLVLASLMGAFAAAVVVFDYARLPAAYQTDIDHVWFAARAIMQGRDPYPLIGPGREFDWLWPLYYPLTAPLAIAPLGLFPVLVARIALTAVPAALLAFLLTRDGYWRLPLFASGAFIASLKLVQWPPILTCALFVPWLGFLAAAKPNIGLAVVAGSRSLRHAFIVGGLALALVALAFAIQPSWYAEWQRELTSAPTVRPFVAIPGGQLLLLALLRWRLPEGRILATLAIVPQTNPSLTTTLFLLLIPRSRVGVTVLSLLTYIPYFFVPEWYAFPSFERYAEVMAQCQVLTVYLPALVALLRLPHIGPAPAFVERAIRNFPAWIRGTGGA